MVAVGDADRVVGALDAAVVVASDRPDAAAADRRQEQHAQEFCGEGSHEVLLPSWIPFHPYRRRGCRVLS
jgi:hypothetical protein